MIALFTKEGDEISIPKKIADTSNLIKGLIDDNGYDDPVPLACITKKTFTIVLEFMTFISTNKKPKIRCPLIDSDLKKSIKNESTRNFYVHFIDEALWKGYLIDIILAANFLDIKSLLKLSVAKLASILKD